MAGTHNAPQSANEAILQNMLGEENKLREPQSRIEELLLEILEQGQGGDSPLEITGYSTDEKPVDDIPEKSLFLELDTGYFFYFDGTQWSKVGN